MSTNLSDEHNPYSPVHEPKKYNVAKLLLSGVTVSFDDLRLAAGGSLSPRTFGQILRDLESQQLSFLRIRDPALGSLYRFDPLVPFDERFRLGKIGPDAQRQAEQSEEVVEDEPAPKPLVEIVAELDEVLGVSGSTATTETVGGVEIDTIFFGTDEDGMAVIDAFSIDDLLDQGDEESS